MTGIAFDGTLFTSDFLTDGIARTQDWCSIDGAALTAMRSKLVAIYSAFPSKRSPNETQTEDDLIWKVLAALDWLTTVEDTRTAEFRQDRFLAAVDWTSADSFRLAYIVRAISPGTYHLPAASVEDMYRPDYRARTGTGTVTVTD